MQQHFIPLDVSGDISAAEQAINLPIPLPLPTPQRHPVPMPDPLLEPTPTDPQPPAPQPPESPPPQIPPPVEKPTTRRREQSVTLSRRSSVVNPKTQMDEDVMQLKSFIETGTPPHDDAESRLSLAREATAR